MTAMTSDVGGSSGSAGDGYRIPAPRRPQREEADADEPGARRPARTPATNEGDERDA